MNKKIKALNIFAFLMLLPALVLLWAVFISLAVLMQPGATFETLKMLLIASAIPSFLVYLIFWNFETEGRLASSFRVLKYVHLLLWAVGSGSMVYILK